MGAALALPPAAASPDAELLAAVAELRRCDAAVDAMNANRVAEADCDAISMAWNEAVDAFGNMEAQSAAGLRAKATAFLMAVQQIRNIDRDDGLNSPAENWEWLAVTFADDVLAVLPEGGS